MLAQILPEGKYLTACYLHLHRNSGKLTIINAGHPPMIHVPVNGKPELILNDGDVLGMFKDAKFGQTSVDVSPGDRLYLYTDGLVESSKNKIPWTRGAQSILPLFKEIKESDIKRVPLPLPLPLALVNRLLGDDFIPEDDIMLLCVEV